MILTFTGWSSITIEHKEGMEKTKLLATKFNLDLPKGADRSKYIQADGYPTADGSKAITQLYVQGLIGNIHYAHQNGFRNDAEHLRFIISELEQGFARVLDAEKSTV